MRKRDERTDSRTQAGDKNSLGFILQNREHIIVNLSEKMGETHFGISNIK